MLQIPNRCAPMNSGRGRLNAVLLVFVSASVLMSWGGSARAADAATDAKASTVTEVVVTAERRTVNLQKAPVAATVLSGADLVKKGVVGVDQLQFISPDLT